MIKIIFMNKKMNKTMMNRKMKKKKLNKVKK